MPKLHKIHHSAHAFQGDISLLTCILRLRILPAVPYSLISDIILTSWPGHALRLASKTLPENLQEGFLKSEAKWWLVELLEETYSDAEKREIEQWVLARERRREDVEAILRVAGLERKGFVVMTREEVNVQIKWRRDGDWRAGSTPLGRVGRPEGREVGEAVRSASESLLNVRNWRQEWAEKRKMAVRGSGHPCWKSFEDQIEEIRGIEESLKREHCEQTR
jgi:hypothetical protein